MVVASGTWKNIQSISKRKYKCGFPKCGLIVASERGWLHSRPEGGSDAVIVICPNCDNPTLLDSTDKVQIPGVAYGSEVKHLPELIRAVWTEIRVSTSNNAHTAVVLVGRKLLMHIAVEQGAEEGLKFVEYVDYLVENHFAPPNSRQWVDKIRSHGNEATHEIAQKTPEDAEEIVIFLEMLLKFIYEFPNRGKSSENLPVG